MMPWIPWIDYDGHDAPAVIKVVDTPLRWLLLAHVGWWLCGAHRGLRWFPSGRLGYRLLRWATRHGDAASTEVFRVPLDPDVAAQVAKAVEAR